ncbi:hypothetical protein ACES2I_01785 [Bdellovibrio bacteriovorus]|uniref:hypothetical protein n=1 Tax=Bdellovibrio bacteriovorus TaxID=959 RepID=UPI0035A71790
MSTLKYVVVMGTALGLLTGCQKELEEASKPRYLYIASGACYSGTGNTTYSATTSSNVIFRIGLETAQYEGRIADFSSVLDAPGTTPVSIVDHDDEHLLALLEHTGQRRIELIKKDLLGERQTFYNNTSATAPIGALQSAARYLLSVVDGLLISRTTAIEKLDTGKSRETGTGTSAWVQGPGGSCSASTTNITSLATYPTSSNAAGYNIIYTHSQNASSANNRIGIMNGLTGWNGTTGCLAAQSGPALTAYPTASVYMPDSGRIAVAYAGISGSMLNSIYTYEVDETANTISDPVNAYEVPSVIYGASAMVYDEVEGHLYVATGGAVTTNFTTGNIPYNIEKFTYDSTTKTFTRVGSTSYYSGNLETRCISSMFIGN